MWILKSELIHKLSPQNRSTFHLGTLYQIFIYFFYERKFRILKDGKVFLNDNEYEYDEIVKTNSKIQISSYIIKQEFRICG